MYLANNCIQQKKGLLVVLKIDAFFYHSYQPYREPWLRRAFGHQVLPNLFLREP